MWTEWSAKLRNGGGQRWRVKGWCVLVAVCINAQSGEQTVRPAETQFAGKSSKSRGWDVRTEMECRPVSPFVVHLASGSLARPSFLRFAPSRRRFVAHSKIRPKIHHSAESSRDSSPPSLFPFYRASLPLRGELPKNSVFRGEDSPDRYLWSLVTPLNAFPFP